MPLPYKTLVLCFDGTWNSLASHTNVSRLYSEVADQSTDCDTQRKFYDEGVGTQWYDRVRGGAFGYGLDRNIRLGYAWLASVYESEREGKQPLAPPPHRKPNGDLKTAPLHSSGVEFLAGSDIYLIGFSRGAFTARSLGGIINYLGIPTVNRARTEPDASAADDKLVREAWDLYLERPAREDRDAAKKAPESKIARDIAEHDRKVDEFRRHPRNRYPVRIHCVAVWDTVGALGVPRVFDREWIPRMSKRYEFHDTTLGESIRNAFHAVAIDEQRLPYKATLWLANERNATENVEQRWFPGAHADVGGGYPDDLLPAPPLEWLAAKTAECGMKFINDRRIKATDGSTPTAIAAAPAVFDLDGTEHLSPVHDSYAEFLGGGYRALRSIPGLGGRVYRRMLVDADGVGQKIDATAFLKWKADPEYRPPNLGQAGRTEVTFNVARDLEPGGFVALPTELPPEGASG